MIHGLVFCAWMFPVVLLIAIFRTDADWPEDWKEVAAVVFAAAFLDFCCFCAINAFMAAGK